MTATYVRLTRDICGLTTPQLAKVLGITGLQVRKWLNQEAGISPITLTKLYYVLLLKVTNPKYWTADRLVAECTFADQYSMQLHPYGIRFETELPKVSVQPAEATPEPSGLSYADRRRQEMIRRGYTRKG